MTINIQPRLWGEGQTCLHYWSLCMNSLNAKCPVSPFWLCAQTMSLRRSYYGGLLSGHLSKCVMYIYHCVHNMFFTTRLLPQGLWPPVRDGESKIKQMEDSRVVRVLFKTLFKRNFSRLYTEFLTAPQKCDTSKQISETQLRKWKNTLIFLLATIYFWKHL